jgi:hypothetical protein
MNNAQQARNGNGRNSNGGNNSNGQRRRPQQRNASAVDIWRTAGPLPALEPIIVSHDVTALIRSLGEPPMNRGIEAGYFFGTVVERTAAIAAALALSADLLATPPG